MGLQRIDNASDKELRTYEKPGGSKGDYSIDRANDETEVLDLTEETETATKEIDKEQKFLLEKINLENYETNMLGFANLDINRDGINEIVYIGNNKENELYTKTDAIRWAKKNYRNYYVQYKNVYDKTINRYVSIYAISDKSYVEGWSLINKDYVSNDEVIATNTEYYDAIVKMTNNLNTLEWNYREYRKEYPVYDGSYRNLIKNEALDFAYNNYENFCILAKSVTNIHTNEKEVIYAFSNTHRIEGWTIIANDFISKDSRIFLTMNDAYNYEYYITDNYSKKLK